MKIHGLARAGGWMLCAVVLIMGCLGAASAKTLHWSSQGDLNSLDPMALNASDTLSVQYAFYEPLVGYDKDMKLIPVLATSWENPEPTRWVFHLREGVQFHDGTPFTADDVVFSWERSLSENSQMSVYTALAEEVRALDEHTVEITTAQPYPILPRNLTVLYMMSRSWAEAHNASKVSSIDSTDDSYAIMHENGTGPFIVTSRQPDVRTTLKRFDGYWDQGIPTNVTEIVFQPIKQASTRVAALLSGDMDLVTPVPIQDWPSLERAADVQLEHTPETRVMYIGLDQFRDELLYSNVKGENPFKDQRVRQAMALTIDTELINKKIMRGAGQPLGTLIATMVNGYDASFGAPYTPDVAKARELLAEAGYPDGFEVRLDCPNDRYVNDERMCQAVASMLAQIGIRIDLLAQTKSKYFAKTNLPLNETSMYMEGWSPASMDAENVLFNLVACRNPETGAGGFNKGGYCSPEIDELTARISAETDQEQRTALIREALALLHTAYSNLPLLQPPISIGVRKGVQVQLRPDSFIDMRHVVLP